MLRKHITRYIYKSNKALYIAICTLLLLMSVLLFSLIFINNSYATLQQKYDSLAQEDFQFIPSYHSQSSDGEDILILEQKYGFKSELLQFKLAESEGIQYKILKHTEHINKPYFIYGGPAITEEEVTIDVNSARRLSLTVDDVLIFQGKLYTVSGIASYPGQVQPNMSLTGYQHYYANEAMLISFSDEVYQDLKLEEKVIYGAVFEQSAQQLDQQLFSFLQYSSDNFEINGLKVKHSMNQMIAGISAGVLSSIILIMLLMLIYKIVKDNEKNFGILKGIGHNNKAIIFAFIPFLLTLSVPIIIGYLISTIAQEAIYLFLNQDLIAPYIKSVHNERFALIFIVVFLVIIVLLAIVMLMLLLKKSPIKLIQPINETRLGLVRQKILNLFNGLSGIRKLQIKYLLSHPFVFILTLFAGFALAVQILLAFAIYEFPDKLVAGIKEQFSYRYDVRLSEPAQLPEHEAYTTYSIEAGMLESSEESKPFDLLIVQNAELQSLLTLKLYGKSNMNITSLLNNGVIISKWTANKYNLEIGDIVTLSINNEPYEMAIAGEHKGLQGSEMYTSARYYEKITNNRVLLVDGFYTNELEPRTLVNVPIKTVTNQHEVIKTAEQGVEQYKVISLALLIIGIVLGAILFAIALYIVMQNGQKHMLLLKALGYTNKQVFTIAIDGYVFILLFGVVIARPYLSLLTTFLFNKISKESSFYLPIESSGIHLSYLVIGVILFFAFISLFYKRKIRNMKSFTALMDE